MLENQIKIIYEDEHIVVLDKPSGLVVNRSNTNSGKTVQDYLEERYPRIFKNVGNSDFINRSGVAHRIDKDTSGILLVTKDSKSLDNLILQFKNREVVKKYIAIVIGFIPESDLVIEAPIKRSPINPLRYAVVEEGKKALTKIHLKKVFTLNGQTYSYVDVFPETGRTHQIRVHMSAFGFPIAGDEIYCTKKQYVDSSKNYSRLMLHSQSISFIHPISGKHVSFESEIPADFLKRI